MKHLHSKTPLLPTAILALACSTAPVVSAPPEPPPHAPREDRGGKRPPGKGRAAKDRKAFREADANKDGFLTFDEFSATKRLARLDEEKRRRIFAFLDKNADGKLHQHELHPGGQRRFGHIIRDFGRFDTDGDGGLSAEELRKVPFFKKMPKAAFQRHFRRLDKNRDGRIGKKELQKRGPRKPFAINFPKHDKDKDGVLSFAEYSSIPFINRLSADRRRAMFDRVDANGDGQLSKQEIRKARPPHRGRRPGGPGHKRRRFF